MNTLYPDFQDSIMSLNEQEVKYLLIGGYAVMIHGYHRTTGDIDIWVEQTPDNYKRLVMAFLHFRMPSF